MCEKLLKIKQHLKQNGITQEKAANQLGVSIMAVNVLLNRKREFGKKNAMAWYSAPCHRFSILAVLSHFWDEIIASELRSFRFNLFALHIIYIMALISLTIVRSRPQQDGSYNVKLALAHGGKTTYISTPYNIDNASQWRNGRVVNRADAAHLNKRLRNILDDYQARIDALPNAALTIAQVRELVTHAPMHKPTIAQYCTQFQASLIRQHRESYATNIHSTCLNMP